MQSGVVMVPEKVPVQWYNHQQQPPHHQMDEREAFFMWLRGEFAAANAMIDALCHHLWSVGDAGEYDFVLASIQQRRCNWNPVLHMQQYFSVADVVYALQHVGWRRQQSMGVDGNARTGHDGKEFRRGGKGYRGGLESQNHGGGVNGKDRSNEHLKRNIKSTENLDTTENEKLDKGEEKKDSNENSEANCFAERQGLRQEGAPQEDCTPVAAGTMTRDISELLSSEKHNFSVSPKTFVASEIYNGISVNVAEGLKLYEDLFDDSEILKLISLVNDLRDSGRKGQLQGQAFVISKRPMKGHGREMIQLGIPIADAPGEDDTLSGSSKDMKIEPIPESFQDAIQRLLVKEVVGMQPDSCTIDIFNEGEYSNPHSWPQRFGRPISVLFLTECVMTFGKVLTADNSGDYHGALKLSLHPGAVLVVEGRSADFAKHAIPASRKQRILVTLIKSQPKKANSGDLQRYNFVAPLPSNWSPPLSRSPNNARRPGPLPSILTTAIARPQLPSRNGVQPIFVPGAVAPGLAFPTTPVGLPPGSPSWPAPSPLRHPPQRLPLLPGTGVFLPPQNSASSPSNHQTSTENATTDDDDASEEVRGGKVTTEHECNATTNAMNGDTLENNDSGKSV